MIGNTKLLAAAAKRQNARDKLRGDVTSLKAQLMPSALADKAISGAVSQAQRLLWRRPATVSGLIGTIGMFVARRQLAKWFRGRRRKRHATRTDDAS